MMPMLRIWSLLDTILRMSDEVLNRGIDYYLFLGKRLGDPGIPLLYIASEWAGDY